MILAVAAGRGVWLGGWFPAVLGSYVLLVVLYSAVLKRVVFIDVLVVAAGFVLRVVGGAVAIDVPVSRWMLLCTYLLALYLALGKRRSELVLLGDDAGTHRVVLGHYTLPLVDQAISVVLGATVLAYTLYTVAPDTVAKVGSEGLMATVPVVLYGLFRYLYLLHRHELGGSPTRVLLTDRPLCWSASSSGSPSPRWSSNASHDDNSPNSRFCTTHHPICPAETQIRPGPFVMKSAICVMRKEFDQSEVSKRRTSIRTGDCSVGVCQTIGCRRPA